MLQEHGPYPATTLLPSLLTPHDPVLDESCKGFKSNTGGSCLLAVCHCASPSREWERVEVEGGGGKDNVLNAGIVL